MHEVFMSDLRFPKSFLWGASTAAYQVEGSPLADGAGPSIWQRFSHTPVLMTGGHTGDGVRFWATLTEPWVVTDGGYLHGALAPRHRNLFETPIASHNLLRAHGRAVQAYRGSGRQQIGIVVNLEPKVPASNSAEDLAANARADAYMNRQYLDPVFFGRYPEGLQETYRAA